MATIPWPEREEKKKSTQVLFISLYDGCFVPVVIFFFFLDATRTETGWAFDNNLTRMHAREAAMNRKIKFFLKSHMHTEDTAW